LKPPKLWDFRIRHNLTGSDLAEMLGVHKSQVSRWETGQRKIPLWMEKFLACLESTLPVKASAKTSPLPSDSGAESK
jgi:transcriptional regulator with XRE-family HTH domain